MSRPAALMLPPTAADGPVDDATVEFAIDLVDRAGVAKTAEAALVKERGRHRSVSATAVLVALTILATTDQPLLLTNVTTLLYQRIGATWRRRLRVQGTTPTDRKSSDARYRCVRYTFGLLCETMDPSQLPKNRRLTAAELAAATRAMTAEDSTAARDRLETFANALLEASMSLLTDDEYSAWDGSAALDATPVPLFSRGPSPRTELCAADPDGGWYVRDGDHRDTDDERTGKRKGRIHWALEATIATMTRDPDATPTYPLLSIGLALDRPGIDPGGTGTRVLASVRARGHRAGWLGYDRAYTSATPHDFHLPIAALGYHPVKDYKIDQLGARANTGGAVLVDGTWHCPATPEPLITATIDARDDLIDNQLHADRVNARTVYQLKPKDTPDVDGYYRMSCPALGSRLGAIPSVTRSSLPRSVRRPIGSCSAVTKPKVPSIAAPTAPHRFALPAACPVISAAPASVSLTPDSIRDRSFPYAYGNIGIDRSTTPARGQTVGARANRKVAPMARPRAFDPESAVAASVGVFGRLGYRGTSIRDLSTELGLSLSSLYRAYGDKHSLFLRALDHYRLTESTQGCQRFLEAEPTIEGLCASLATMILTDDDLTDPMGCFVVNTAAELGPTDPDVVERTEAAFALTRAGLRDLIERLHQNGSLRRDCSVDAIIDTLFTLTLGWQLRVRAGHDPDDLRTSIRAAVQAWTPDPS